MSDWALDRSVGLSFILALIVYGISMIWWASAIDQRTARIEEYVVKSEAKFKEIDERRIPALDRLTRMEEQLRIQNQLLNQILRNTGAAR